MQDRPLDRDDVAKALRMLSAGSQAEPASELTAEIGKYSILRKLGFDGQATVLLAHDTQLIRDVVLKIYHDAVDENQRIRIINEGRALAQINSENVVRCYGVEESDGVLMLVLEFIDGQSLTDYIADHQLSFETKMQLFRQLVSGVKASHDKGVLHLDLKPGNVLITDDEVVKLIDFGLVQAANSQPNLASSSGTPAFMPPEIATSDDAITIGESTDVFGLGSVLYFMLTGNAPFESDSKNGSRALAEACDVDFASHLDRSTPKAIVRISNNCLQKSQRDRYPTTKSLLKDVDRYLKKLKTRRQLGVGLVAAIFMLGLFSIPFLLPAKLSTSQRLQRLEKKQAAVLELVSQGKWSEAIKEQNACVQLAKHRDFENSHLSEQLKKKEMLAVVASGTAEEQGQFRRAIKTLHNLGLALRERDWESLRNYTRQFADNEATKNLLDLHPNNVYASDASDVLARAQLSLSAQGTPLPQNFPIRLGDSGMKYEFDLGMQSKLSLSNKMNYARFYEQIGLKNESARTWGAVCRLTETMKGYGQLLHSQSQLELAMLMVSQQPVEANEFFKSYVDYQKTVALNTDESSNKFSEQYLVKLCDFIIHSAARNTDMSIVLGQELLQVVPTTLAERKLRMLVTCRLCVAAARKAKNAKDDQAIQSWISKAQSFRNEVLQELDQSFSFNNSIVIEADLLLASATAELDQWDVTFELMDEAIAKSNMVFETVSGIGKAESAVATFLRILLEDLRYAVEAGNTERATKDVTRIVKENRLLDRTAQSRNLERAMELLPEQGFKEARSILLDASAFEESEEPGTDGSRP